MVNSNVHNSTVSIMCMVHRGIDIQAIVVGWHFEAPCAGSISYGMGETLCSL